MVTAGMSRNISVATILLVLAVPFAAAAKPACWLYTHPATTTPGQAVSLRWGTTNTFVAFINNRIGVITPNQVGSRIISHTATTTYTLTALGPDGIAECSTRTAQSSGSPAVAIDAASLRATSTTPIITGTTTGLSSTERLYVSIISNPGPARSSVSGWAVRTGERWRFSVPGTRALERRSYIVSVATCPYYSSATGCSKVLGTGVLRIQ